METLANVQSELILPPPDGFDCGDGGCTDVCGCTKNRHEFTLYDEERPFEENKLLLMAEVISRNFVSGTYYPVFDEVFGNSPSDDSHDADKKQSFAVCQQAVWHKLYVLQESREKSVSDLYYKSSRTEISFPLKYKIM